jgi:DNA-binding transcriptional MerR regulator
MKAISDKKYTARELAAQFGCSAKTIANHANKLFGKNAKGVRRYFDEAQVTLILESIKSVAQAGGRQTSKTDFKVDLRERAAKAETSLTPILRLQFLQEQKERIHEEELAIYRNIIKRLEGIVGEQLAWLDGALEANT